MLTEIKILEALLQSRNRSYTIRGLSEKIGSDYKITHTAVQELLKKELVKKRKVGRAIEINLTNNFSKEVFEAEYNRRKELLKNSNFNVLQNKLNSTKFPLIALVFGSYAKEEQAKKSDIDLMIICEEKRQEEIENIISLLPLDIHLITLTYEEFLEMAKSKEFSVVSEAMNSNIILIGIEDYYRLIKNAR